MIRELKLLWATKMGAVLALSIVSSASAVTNEWTKPTSGYWEEPYWSLGVLPSAGQEAVVFNNPGWKALAIGANTTANYPGSLRINNLIIDAPTNSANRLLLNWAGFSVPLVVRSNLMIGTNGSLVSQYSDLQAAGVELRGFAEFSDHATAGLNEITLRSGSVLGLKDTYLTCSNLGFWGGIVTQSMGIAVISRIATFEQYFAGSFRIDNAYVLSDGLLYSGVADVGHFGLSGADDLTFSQSGGVHSNGTMTVWGGGRHFQQVIHAGHYLLSGGRLVSEQTTIQGGTMDQSGGTNLTRELVVAVGGEYTLNGGQLVASNATLGTLDCLHRGFVQNGGSHTVQSRLTLGDGATYSLSAGTLGAPIIEINTSAGLAVLGGQVSNSGMMVLRRGFIRVEGSTQQFGKLQVLEGVENCGFEPSVPATLYLGLSNSNAPAVLRFQDSHDLPWAATLRILNWSANFDHLFVGTTAQGLTSAQLQQIVFVNPGGFPGGSYPARILANGEVVPAVGPPLGYSRSQRSLVLSWSGNYQLWTTTNIVGTWTLIPGATSPYTNSFTERQRYFKLRAP